MGLEMGSPWLVLVENGDKGERAVILVKDNFTGAGLQRIIAARKQERGSYAAVMSKNGRFAEYPDGRLYDPVEETKGRDGGTAADRGYVALSTAEALFRQMDGMPWQDAQKAPSGFRSAGQILEWGAIGWAFSSYLALSDWFNSIESLQYMDTRSGAKMLRLPATF